MLCLSPMRAESTPVRADSRSTAVNIDCAWLCCAVEPCISQAMLCCRTMCSYLWSSSVWGKFTVKNCSKCTSWNSTSSISRSIDPASTHTPTECCSFITHTCHVRVTSWHSSFHYLAIVLLYHICRCSLHSACSIFPPLSNTIHRCTTVLPFIPRLPLHSIPNSLLLDS